jgi:hypothetical protein
MELALKGHALAAPVSESESTQKPCRGQTMQFATCAAQLSRVRLKHMKHKPDCACSSCERSREIKARIRREGLRYPGKGKYHRPPQAAK